MKKIKLFIRFSLFFILLNNFVSYGQEVIILDDKKSVIDLWKSMEYYQDESKLIQIEEIRQDTFQQKFKNIHTEVLNLRSNAFALWLKIQIKNQTSDRYYLQIDSPYLDSVLFYFEDEKGNIKYKLTGKKFSISTEDIASTHCIIEIPLQNNQKVQTFYLRLISNRHFRIDARLMSQKSILNKLSQRYIFELIYFGIIFLAILYNLFVYFSTKDTAFLYYVIYTFLMGLNVLNTRGYLSLFFPEHRNLLSQYTYLPTSIYVIFVLLFTINFLKVKQHSLLLYRVLLFILFVSFLRAFLAIIGYRSFLLNTDNEFFLITVSSYLISGVVIYYKKYQPAIYYLISWTMFAFFTIWVSLEYADILTLNSFSKYLTPIGIGLETIFSSLGLANRINVLKKNNFDLIKKQKDSLEEEVKTRTKELEERNQEIETQNEELHQQKEELLIINDHLEIKNNLIESQKAELENINHVLKESNTKLEESDAKIKEQNAELSQKQIKMIAQNEKLYRQKKEIEALKNSLEGIVAQRTNELKKALDDVTKQNQDLSQFSYIISHNIRAPIARILGLVNIFNEQNYDDDFNKDIISHLRKATTDLDTVIKDLTQIISIRNDINKTKEDINIFEAIDLEKFLLQDEIERSKVSINTELVRIKSIHSIKPYFQSILHNLLSNAIKYKSNKRRLVVTIKIEQVSNSICLSVQDNGLGIDLTNVDTYKIFGLYQRMHDHVEGKGLGLFLVKTQIESLGGKIEVESQLNVGTTFRVYFPIS